IMDTLVEFLDPVKKESSKQIVLYCLYYLQFNLFQTSIKASEITDALKKSHITRVKNVGVTLRQNIPYVEQLENSNWRLTKTGKKEVEKAIKPSSILEEAKKKVTIATAGIIDEKEKNYIEESLKCLEANALRGAVIMAWIATMHNISVKIENFSDSNFPNVKGLIIFLNTLKQTKPNSKPVKDSKELREKHEDYEILEICYKMRIFDKSQWKRLKEALDLRNDCGHPTDYIPKEHKVNSFLEDIIEIVLSK
ncbi:MAG: hypothetical protein HGB11_02630, partial [Chlorobiales bacterium]|nr:hypothetical protein [Chlorobiales bacterium]